MFKDYIGDIDDDVLTWHLSHVYLGMVLGVLVAGGSLMADNRFTAGDLMSFLVSTQTIQKWVLVFVTFNLIQLLYF